MNKCNECTQVYKGEWELTVYQWTWVDISEHEYTWVNVSLHQWTCMCMSECECTSVNISEYECTEWIWDSKHECTSVNLNEYECTWIKLSVNILGFMCYPGFSVTENKFIILFNFNKAFDKVFVWWWLIGKLWHYS